VLTLVGGKFAADDSQRVVDFFAGIRSVENRKVQDGLAGARRLDDPQHMLCWEHGGRIQIDDLVLRLDQIHGGGGGAVLGMTIY
jgi:hypothetical protein